MILKVTSIERPFKEGITKPFLCLCEGNKQYVVKSLLLSEFFAEIICVELLKHLKLPHLDYAIVEIGDDIKQHLKPEQIKNLNKKYYFATVYLPNSTTPVPEDFNKYLSKEEQILLYLFDRRINNSDRTPKNTNLLLCKTDSGDKKIYIIDHNLAFDTKNNDFSEHIFAEKNRTWDFGLFDKNSFQDLIKEFLLNFDELINKIIPDKLYPIDDEEYKKFESHIQHIKNTLQKECSDEG